MDDGYFALAALTVLRSCDAPTLVTWMPPFPGARLLIGEMKLDEAAAKVG